VRAYLQVACAGLGFDIGEIWWTNNENGSSTVAAIGEFFVLRIECARKFVFAVTQCEEFDWLLCFFNDILCRTQ
jgi:hypothetical protein